MRIDLVQHIADKLFKDEITRLVNKQYKPKLYNQNVLLQLDITNVCNFRCDYCYRLNELGSSILEPKIALARVNKFIATYKPIKLRIEFYGGEPLTNINTILYVINSLHIKDIPINYFTITNCSIYNDEIAKLVKDHVLYMEASIDAAERHYISRRSVDHKPTNDLVLNTYKRYCETAFPLPVRTSVLTKADIYSTYEHILAMNRLYSTTRFTINIIDDNLKFDIYKFFMRKAREFFDLGLIVCPFTCYYHKSTCPLSISTSYRDNVVAARFEILLNGDIYWSPYYATNLREKIGNIDEVD